MEFMGTPSNKDDLGFRGLKIYLFRPYLQRFSTSSDAEYVEPKVSE
jgi:hypothetical protein